MANHPDSFVEADLHAVPENTDCRAANPRERTAGGARATQVAVAAPPSARRTIIQVADVTVVAANAGISTSPSPILFATHGPALDFDDPNTREVIVVGGGIAGLSAAIYPRPRATRHPGHRFRPLHGEMGSRWWRTTLVFHAAWEATTFCGRMSPGPALPCAFRAR